MNEESRRKLLAISALVLGLFLGLSLLPAGFTGPLGGWLGRGLWRLLGIGAVGLPLLGIGLALAGLGRLGALDMRRVGWLVVGLSVVTPYLIAVIADSGASDYVPPLEEWSLNARLTGLVPGLAARVVTGVVGTAGGLLVGFLLLSVVTLLTIRWHPLAKFERGSENDGRDDDRGGRSREADTDEGLASQTPWGEQVLVVGESESEAKADEPPRKKTPKKVKEPPAKRAPESATIDAAAYIEDEELLPPIDLLRAAPEEEGPTADQALDRLGRVLIDTLRTFKVEGEIVGRTTGPVVTQFEIKPAAGVKVGKIAALADDLALAMHAPSIRIVAPIPGRGAVGVEVPNPTAKVVNLRELIDADEWHNARATLPIALGRDLEGRPVIADLAKMPHLLIAGATGSGKSVAINTIITSLIYRYTRKDLRLLMIDPKMVELSMYNSLPHLRHKVVTNNHEAAQVLKWAVIEMERRYELLHENNARNVTDFNRKLADGKPLRNPVPPQLTLSDVAAEAEGSPPPEQVDPSYTDGPLPYIVVIVDELADLMMTVQGEVETPLAMLAQKARAIGIHIILATQRPSVNVITGLIKANFPSRIAFRVASKVDSRTILDQNGAESLLGNGDMLFLPPGKSVPLRLQGAFIATEETEQVTQWYVDRREARRAKRLEEIKEEADILAQVRALEAEDTGGPSSDGSEDRDSLFREAAEACLQNQGGSTSLLQRKLRIGYGRAARIIDQLYDAGILGPPDGSKPREILIGFDQLDEYCN